MSIVDLYQRLGEQKGIRALVDEFYDLMDSLPEAEIVRKLHPEDLTESRLKLYEFLVGWSGGPPLFQEKYGHPRLRMRHQPFPIGESERDQWMLCMKSAMSNLGLEDDISKFLEARFLHIADFMRNI